MSKREKEIGKGKLKTQSIVTDERSNGYCHCAGIYRRFEQCSMNYLALVKWPSVYLPSNRNELHAIREARLISPTLIHRFYQCEMA